MKKFSLKYQLTLLLSISTTTSHHIIAQETASVEHAALAQAAAACSAESTETPMYSTEEVEFLVKIIKRIKQLVTTSKNRVDAFFDKTNKQPYAQHLDLLRKDIATFHVSIIVPLEKELEKNDQLSDEYKQILNNALDIMKTIEMHTIGFMKVLNSPKYMPSKSNQQNPNKTAIMLAGELKQIKADSEERFDRVIKQLESLSNTIKSHDELIAAALNELLQEVATITNAKQPSQFQLLNGLVIRLRS